MYVHLGCASSGLLQNEMQGARLPGSEVYRTSSGFLIPNKSSTPILGAVSADSQSVNTDTICCTKASKHG